MKKIIFLIGALLLSSVVNAAVTVDTTATGTGNEPLNISRSITTDATLDLLLCASDSSVNVVTSVTRSTDTYTELTTLRVAGGGTINSVWYKVNPLSGTNNITASVASVTEGVACAGISFFGSDTTNPFTDQQGNAGGSSDMSESHSINAAIGEIVVDLISFNNGSTALTAGANQTDVMSVEDTGVGHGIGVSYEAGNGGSVTMSWTWATASLGSPHSLLVVKAASTAAGQFRRRNQ